MFQCITFIIKIRWIPWFILLINALGNGLVIYIIVKKRLTRDHQLNFIMNLAINNILFAVKVVLVYLLMQHGNSEEVAVCRIYYSVDVGLTRFFLVSLVLWTVTLNVNKYIAVVHGMQYHAIVTKSRVICLMIFVWCFSGSIAITSGATLTNAVAAKAIASLLILILIFVIFASIFTSHTVNKSALNQMQKIMRQTTSLYGESRERIDTFKRQQWRTKGIAYISYISLLLFVPILAILVLQLAKHSFSIKRHEDMLYRVLAILIIGYSSISPLLYIMSMRSLREAIYIAVRPTKVGPA